MLSVAGLTAAATMIASGVTDATDTPVRAHAAYVQQCSEAQYPAQRDPSNPLLLPNPPGSNPLRGARFFVDGPRHGVAAGAIEQLLGIDPMSYPDDYSWAQFKQDLDSGPLHRPLAANPGLAYQVRMLSKLAEQPEEQRFSLGAGGGGPGATFAQVEKILCHNMTADPGTIPIITTFFLYQAGYCETREQILAHRPTFERQIDEMVQGIDRRPAVMLLELDAIGASKCMQQNGALPDWEQDIRYEIDKVSALPHTVVYMEAGYSDVNSPAYTAQALDAVGIRKIRGFMTNDTHLMWTSQEISWGDRVSQMTGGSDFVINTASNGRGPQLNPHPGRQGYENLCNPAGRGIGPPVTADTGFKHVDAFVWTGVPGYSSGSCGGGPPGGTYWIAKAVGMAARAQAKIGPGYPDDPY